MRLGIEGTTGRILIRLLQAGKLSLYFIHTVPILNSEVAW